MEAATINTLSTMTTYEIDFIPYVPMIADFQFTSVTNGAVISIGDNSRMPDSTHFAVFLTAAFLLGRRPQVPANASWPCATVGSRADSRAWVAVGDRK